MMLQTVQSKLVQAAPFTFCALNAAGLLWFQLRANHNPAKSHMVNWQTLYYSLLWATIALLWNNVRLLCGIIFGKAGAISKVATIGNILFAFSYPILALVCLELVCTLFDLAWIAWFSDMILPTFFFIGVNCLFLDLMGHSEYTDDGGIPRYTIVNQEFGDSDKHISVLGWGGISIVVTSLIFSMSRGVTLPITVLIPAVYANLFMDDRSFSPFFTLCRTNISDLIYLLSIHYFYYLVLDEVSLLKES